MLMCGKFILFFFFFNYVSRLLRMKAVIQKTLKSSYQVIHLEKVEKPKVILHFILSKRRGGEVCTNFNFVFFFFCPFNSFLRKKDGFGRGHNGGGRCVYQGNCCTFFILFYFLLMLF